jgi:hypothetical protein
MRDRDIRVALTKDLRVCHFGDPYTAIIDELSIKRNGARIDVALVNGVLHGFELKSDLDTLCRLPEQVPAYGEVCDHVTLVVGERHVLTAIELVPDWWGIKLARRKSGTVAFCDLKLAQINPCTKPIAVAQLLRREEALNILIELGAEVEGSRASRKQLCMKLAETIEFKLLSDKVRCCLRARQPAGIQLSSDG